MPARSLAERLMNRRPARQGLRLLLVDDSDAFIEAVAAFLDELPWIGAVEIARSAEEAIVFAAHYRPDLVLMDYQMPGATGIEALRAIKSRAETPRIVIMTLHDSNFLAREAHDAGADGFVAKDALFNDLPRLLRRLFGAPPADPMRD